MDLSIVIPVRNRRNRIRCALHSLTVQEAGDGIAVIRRPRVAA